MFLLTYHNSVDEISAGFYLIKFDYEEQDKTLSNDLATVRMRVGRLKNMNKRVIDSFQKRIAVLQTFLKARSVDQKKELREHLLNTPACADTQWVLSQLEKL